MTGRDVGEPLGPLPDLVLRAPRHWTAGLFLLGLGGLHYFNGLPAVIDERWEGMLSVGLGSLFLLAACVCLASTRQIILCPNDRSVKIRNGVGRIGMERRVPFGEVCGVRLTLVNGKTPRSSRLEILCDGDTIDCPPSNVPRQQALFMAMTMQVRLIKVYATPVPQSAERIHQLTSPERSDADSGNTI